MSLQQKQEQQQQQQQQQGVRYGTATLLLLAMMKRHAAQAGIQYLQTLCIAGSKCAAASSQHVRSRLRMAPP
jgi:hypothetical protein